MKRTEHQHKKQSLSKANPTIKFFFKKLWKINPNFAPL